MEHTPFGYVIVDGRPKVHEMEAARLTTLFSSYLLGLSRESAAEVAGIKANHTEVKRMLQNVHYLGDDVYPRIIEDDIFNAVQAERLTAFSDEVFTKHVDRVIFFSRKEVGFVMKCGPVFRERI